jgi:DNA-binding response OmpR family regulator
MHGNPKTKGRILCTENDADARALNRLCSHARGYDVTTTEKSIDALALVKLERFDLLLVDNWMPRLSGPDLRR